MVSSERANIKVMFVCRHTVFIENIETKIALAYNTSIHTNGELDVRNSPRRRVINSCQSQ